MLTLRFALKDSSTIDPFIKDSLINILRTIKNINILLHTLSIHREPSIGTSFTRANKVLIKGGVLLCPVFGTMRHRRIPRVLDNEPTDSGLATIARKTGIHTEVIVPAQKKHVMTTRKGGLVERCKNTLLSVSRDYCLRAAPISGLLAGVAALCAVIAVGKRVGRVAAWGGVCYLDNGMGPCKGSLFVIDQTFDSIKGVGRFDTLDSEFDGCFFHRFFVIGAFELIVLVTLIRAY